MMLIANTGFLLTSFFLFLFLLWRRLKDDYAVNIIFSTGFIIFFSMLVFWYGSSFFDKQWFFWFLTLGLFIGFFISVFRFKMRFNETFEALVVGILPVLSIFYIYDSVQNSSIVSFASFLLSLLLIFIFYFIDSNYKSFAWYKSGRIGLAGLVVFLAFFVGRFAINRILGFDLYFSIFIVIMTLWQLYRIQKI